VPRAGDDPFPDLAIAFAETPGRFVCEVRPEPEAAFAALLDREAPNAWGWIGTVAAEPVLELVATDGTVDRLPVARLAAAWRREER
jgi:phosphoribosylformylglycinamidine (FGAM) synthase-like enzyme